MTEAKKTTRWTADCGCVMEYDWKPAVLTWMPNVHSNFRTIRTCDEHAHHVKCKDRYDALIDKCKREAALRGQ